LGTAVQRIHPFLNANDISQRKNATDFFVFLPQFHGDWIKSTKQIGVLVPVFKLVYKNMSELRLIKAYPKKICALVKKLSLLAN
jgi:hypothetical protein